MQIEDLDPDALWLYYQRGYHCLVRSGLYFRQVLRPALSHVYFQRAMPLLMEYARANHGSGDLPPGFGDQMQACPLTPRDLLHLDYAICLGYAETQGENARTLQETPVLDWPGPSGYSGLFIAADTPRISESEKTDEEFSELFETPTEEESEEEEDRSGEDENSEPPFDL